MAALEDAAKKINFDLGVNKARIEDNLDGHKIFDYYITPFGEDKNTVFDTMVLAHDCIFNYVITKKDANSILIRLKDMEDITIYYGIKMITVDFVLGLMEITLTDKIENESRVISFVKNVKVMWRDGDLPLGNS
jgi:hypothetical protein